MNPSELIMCVGGPAFSLLSGKTLPGNRARAASIYDVIYTPYHKLHLHVALKPVPKPVYIEPV